MKFLALFTVSSVFFLCLSPNFALAKTIASSPVDSWTLVNGATYTSTQTITHTIGWSYPISSPARQLIFYYSVDGQSPPVLIAGFFVNATPGSGVLSFSFGPLSVGSHTINIRSSSLVCAGWYCQDPIYIWDHGSISINIIAPPPAPTSSVSVSPDPVPYGGNPGFTLSSANAAYCYILIDWTAPYILAGTATSGTYYKGAFTVAGAHTASSLCYNSVGSYGAGWSTTNFTVSDPPPAPTSSVSVSPSPVPYGGNPGFTLTSTNATSCYILIDWTAPYILSGTAVSGTYYQGAFTTPGAHTASSLCYNSVGSYGAGWVTTNFTVNAPSAPVVTMLLNNAASDVVLATPTSSFTLQATGTNNPTACFMTKLIASVGSFGSWAPYTCSAYTSATIVVPSTFGFTSGLNAIAIHMLNAGGDSLVVTRYVTVPISNPLPCDIAHVTSWGTCTSSATCTQPPAQLTGQPGTHVGTCPSPAYTGTVVDTCSTATITCTVPATSCGNNICETGETFGNCPHDCRGRVQQF